MTAQITEADRRLIYHLSGDLGDRPDPFAALAEILGRDEEDVLAAVERFKEMGLIRRFGATLWHQKSGFSANAMVVWQVEEGRAAQCGREMAALPFVSHCYLRRAFPRWPYNLYTMIHAEKPEGLSAMIQTLAALAPGAPWRRLDSLKELKKASLRYFRPTESGGADF